MQLDARHRLFLALAATFCTCLVVGDLVGGKLVSGEIAGYRFTTTVGMIPFPVTFLLTDVLNEFYGKKAARLVTWLGFSMALLALLLVTIAEAIPIADLTRAPDWTGVTAETFANVFGGSRRMLLASLAAFLVAQFVDIWVFHRLKSSTKGRMLWLRAAGSTAASQWIDTVVINFVAWSFVLPFSTILNVIFSAYGLKILIALGLTPLLYFVHEMIERGFGLSPERYQEDEVVSTE